jgi:periplasmic divalent cation tolerance protein
MPIQSTYFWEGAIEDSKEFLMLFKTTVAAAVGLREFLEKNHSYDVPEIVEIPVSGGGAGYLQWITANTSVS